MSQMTDVYLERAMHQIEQLQELLETTRGELVATNLAVHALAVAQGARKPLEGWLDAGEQQILQGNPAMGVNFHSGFTGALKALRDTMSNSLPTPAQ